MNAKQYAKHRLLARCWHCRWNNSTTLECDCMDGREYGKGQLDQTMVACGEYKKDKGFIQPKPEKIGR